MKDESFRRKNIQMLATLMATATYAAGFNPPGGVWQDSAGHLPGDPMMRSGHHHRYMVFIYFNAAAFALSLMVVVVTLFVAACPKKSGHRFDLPLILLTLMASVAFMVAYGTGACRDKFTIVVYSVFVAVVVPSCLCQLCSLYFISLDDDELGENAKYRGKLIAPLSMFALTISYLGGLSTPGGFWDSAEGGRRPGDSILHGKLLHWFSYFNTAQFISSLQGVFLVMCSGLHLWLAALGLKVGLLGLIGAYTVGSSRGRHATVGVILSLCAAIGAYALIHVLVRVRFSSFFEKQGKRISTFFEKIGSSSDVEDAIAQRQRGRASALVQLLSGLAVSVTYQAGMYPPGGVWQVGDKAGDPILLTTNPGRYKAFYLCNSVAFVASLFAILLGQKRYLRKHHALQAAMILDLLALIVAYAIGSCRDQISTMYVLGIAGAAVVYVVIHVQYFTLGATKDDDAATAVVDKRGRRFFLFAILVASITYQAGLTPPGGFLLQDGPAAGDGGHVGDPVLLYNYPRRYKAFFYCNSVSFMVSTVLLLLLVNPNMSRPAIRSHALSLCSAVSFVCLIGAFAAGSTQHLKTSIYIFVVTSVAVFLCLPLLLTIFSSYFLRDDAQPPPTEKAAPDHRSQKMVDLMTLGIIVGSVAYQAGLDPPGGSWQSGSAAGHPVMHDRRKGRYLAFLCGNSTSFISSIYLIEILLFTIYFPKSKGLDKAIEPMVVAQYLGFLVAYAAGSSRQWRVSAHVGTMVIAVLAYVATHVMLSFCIKKESPKPGENTPQQEDEADPDEADPSSSPPSA